MSDLDAVIRERLRPVPTVDQWHEWAHRAHSALTAVLERHKPGYPDGPEYEEHDEPVFDRAGIPQGTVRVKGDPIPGYYCETCREFTPCPTVRDIAKELGIEADD